MCRVIFFGDQTIHSVAELHAHWPMIPADIDQGVRDLLNGGSCLCCVDVFGVLRRANISYQIDDIGDIIISDTGVQILAED